MLDSGMSPSPCPFWEEVGKSRIVPSGSGRWHCEFHLVLSVPLPRPCLSSSLTYRQHGPAGNQRQLCAQAVQCVSSRQQERRFGVRETKVSDEQQMVFPFASNVYESMIWQKNMEASKSDWVSSFARPVQQLEAESESTQLALSTPDNQSVTWVTQSWYDLVMAQFACLIGKWTQVKTAASIWKGIARLP